MGSVVLIVPVLLRFVLLQCYILPSANGEGVKSRRGEQSLAGTIRRSARKAHHGSCRMHEPSGVTSGVYAIGHGWSLG